MTYQQRWRKAHPNYSRDYMRRKRAISGNKLQIEREKFRRAGIPIKLVPGRTYGGAAWRKVVEKILFNNGVGPLPEAR